MDYNEFLSGLEPTVIGLDNSSCIFDRKAYWAMPRSGAKRLYSSRYELTTANSDYFDVTASFDFCIQWGAKDNDRVQPLILSCAFTGHFHAKSTIERANAEKFAESDCWIIFWPYFRQYLSDMTSKMAIPPVIAPMALGPGETTYVRRLDAQHETKDSAKPKRIKHK